MSKPDFNAYTVREYENDGKKDAAWNKIGVAFAHKDGKGFDVVLDSLPVGGHMSLREPREKDEAKSA